MSPWQSIGRLSLTDSTKAGTLQYAELKPDLPAALFPPPSRGATSVVDRQTAASTLVDQIGARQRSENIIREEDYDFGGDGLNDDELLAAGT